MLLQVLILVLSIVALYYGAEFALEAAEKVGKYLGFSPLAIGLVIVGFGTSLPEFFVSQLASYRGESSIALGNIVGSNIANMFLILGLAGFFTTLKLGGRELKKQFNVHLFVSVVLSYGLLTQDISLPVSLLLIASFIYFLYVNFRAMKEERSEGSEERGEIKAKDIIMLLLGFFFLYLGGELLVSSGTKLGKMAGISTYVISAIFVAFGTSFPELITTILACLRKKDTDLIVGNIIGSNIFNVAFVLGSLIIYKVPVEHGFKYESTLLLGAAFFFILMGLLKKSFGKLSGGVFLGSYLFMIFHWIN